MKVSHILPNIPAFYVYIRSTRLFIEESYIMQVRIIYEELIMITVNPVLEAAYVIEAVPQMFNLNVLF